MKTFITAITVTILLLSGITSYLIYHNNTTKTFSDLTTKIISSVSKEEWDMCEEHIQKFEDKWKKQKNVLSAFTDHEDLDSVEQTLKELKESIRYKNKEDTSRYASVLLTMIERLEKNELPTWENILRHTRKQKSCIKCYSRLKMKSRLYKYSTGRCFITFPCFFYKKILPTYVSSIILPYVI